MVLFALPNEVLYSFYEADILPGIITVSLGLRLMGSSQQIRRGFRLRLWVGVSVTTFLIFILVIIIVFRFMIAIMIIMEYTY